MIMSKFPVTKAILKKRRVSSAQFARDIGVSATYVRLIMDGKTAYPCSEKVINDAQEWLNYCHACKRKIEDK